MSSRVVSGFVGLMDKHPQLSFFMGLIGAMGGNTGMQSSAIIVQSLASGSLGLDTTWSKLFKEIAIAIMNATVLSLIILTYNFIISEDIALTYTVSIAMFSVVNICLAD